MRLFGDGDSDGLVCGKGEYALFEVEPRNKQQWVAIILGGIFSDNCK